jgi:uncharacterized protein YdeI (YjbR/CyaY-like superfamily)
MTSHAIAKYILTMSDVIFFKFAQEIRPWFKKNHRKMNQQWLGFYKKTSTQQIVSSDEVRTIAMCFGWSDVNIRSIDYHSYKVQFYARKAGSVWSLKNIKKFQTLKKEGLIQPQGQWAFDHRDKKKSEKKKYSLTPTQLKYFKKNKVAWNFFNSQSLSYIKYMLMWIESAQREETKAKRLAELIQDSGEQTKLKRLLKFQTNLKPKYEAGKTPIEAGKNLGPTTGNELRSIGIDTLEKLQAIGWEKAFIRWIELYPNRLKLVVACVVIGAVEDCLYHDIDPELKAEAKRLVQELNYGLR